MSRFYQIARLTVGVTIFPSEEGLRVDLDGLTPADLIENDVAFRTAAAPDVWFWLSGGGTLLLNGRYLLVVQRSLDARVNPGKFSLFTGRADNDAERADPALMARELFEELLLYEGSTLLTPRVDAWQPVIDAAHAAMRAAGIIEPGSARDIILTPVALPTRPVVIRHRGAEREHALAWTAGANNDINALFLFAADCDIARLAARDGEFHVAGGNAHKAGRQIFLLDLLEGFARTLSEGQPVCLPQRDAMTPPLQFLLDVCRGSWRG